MWEKIDWEKVTMQNNRTWQHFNAKMSDEKTEIAVKIAVKSEEKEEEEGTAAEACPSS